jgi:hypothetical protein
MLSRKSKCQFLQAGTIVSHMLLGKTIDASRKSLPMGKGCHEEISWSLPLVPYGGHMGILWSHGAHKETASLWKELSRNHQFDMCEQITALIYNAHYENIIEYHNLMM